MPGLKDYYDFRDGLADAVIRDLVGPGRFDEPRPDEEMLTEAPMNRYVSGILYPPAPDPIDAIEDNDLGDLKDADRDDEADPPVAMANIRYPSAMGMTCGVDRSMTRAVHLTVSAARYRAEDPDDGEVERWSRHPATFEHEISLEGRTRDYRQALGDGLEVFVREREPDGAGRSALTVALINTLVLPQDEYLRDAYSFFQVEMVLEAGGSAVFVDRSKAAGSRVDDDAGSYALLYRHSPSFAVGHGCGASWDEGESEPGRATRVRSTATPSHDLLLADNNPEVTSRFFGMRVLAEDSRSEVVNGLREFVGGYREWIDDRWGDLDALAAEHGETARRHLDDCSTAASRIEGGIDLLERDDRAWLAFQLANRAMLVQRARADWVRGSCEGEPDLSGDAHQWRAFQIGFILMALQGIADPRSDERSVVDLLWFPTGGGKTEAYLGLIAFSVFLRRLRGVAAGGSGAGMTVIMRYTLRLLTLQQYQRAALLICACESIRRSRDDLGGDEISIGLWVGGAATPNTLAETRSSLEKLRGSGDALQEKDPVQLRECPWCAKKLSHRNYWVADRDPRLVISCRNELCEFEKALPCYLVDEDIYSRRPTLMIATVDKFASMPWRETIGPLFNVNDIDGPPEMIIQDELHLISGPLGTMVGLYETAVHMLCSDGGVGPKVIASTATIRRAEQQIRKLYAASSFQFPPPGIDARDSYFAVEVPRESKGTRRYVGLMAPGTSHATLLVRSYAALLQKAAEIDGSDEVRDPYWTLLGYFNSLRVLGGARMQVRDDVCDRIELLSPEEKKRRLTSDSLELIEMTSRVESSEIPGYLQQMGVSIDDPDCLDVILATNMISVGVDVDRLGLMAVMGQPQSASEYIQATSRVGRRHPGLVMVLFNSARSRDRSHFEDFESFHGSLYRQVDASSVTPFAARARDRALHAVFVGMLRATDPTYRDNKSAANVADLEVAAQPVIDRILTRVAATEPGEVEGTEESLRALIRHWKWRASEQPKLVFSNRRHPELALLADASRPEVAEEHEAFSTMWSLRAVDTESNLFLVRD